MAAAFVDMGPMNNVVMLTIASSRRLLVVLFFMHVRWSSRLTWVVAAAGFFWLLILFGITMGDYMTRGWIPGHTALTLASNWASRARRYPARLFSFWPPTAVRRRQSATGRTGVNRDAGGYVNSRYTDFERPQGRRVDVALPRDRPVFADILNQ